MRQLIGMRHESKHVVLFCFCLWLYSLSYRWGAGDDDDEDDDDDDDDEAVVAVVLVVLVVATIRGVFNAAVRVRAVILLLWDLTIENIFVREI